jgi:hypothetical protein
MLKSKIPVARLAAALGTLAAVVAVASAGFKWK